MAYKGVIDDFRLIRKNGIPRRVPCLSCSEEFDVRWHGKYTYEEFCQDGNRMFEVFRAAVERLIETHYDGAGRVVKRSLPYSKNSSTLPRRESSRPDCGSSDAMLSS